jgi:hypothetical protein
MIIPPEIIYSLITPLVDKQTYLSLLLLNKSLHNDIIKYSHPEFVHDVKPEEIEYWINKKGNIKLSIYWYNKPNIDLSQIRHLKNLISLTIKYIENILNPTNPTININTAPLRDEYIKDLINLKNLNLELCDLVSGEGIKNLKSLEELKLGENRLIKNDDFENLKKLRYLYLPRNNTNITYDGLKHLSSLSGLHLDGNSTIKDEDLVKLKDQLTWLYLYEGCVITDDALKMMTELKYLNLRRNQFITDASLKYLANLQKISLYKNYIVKGDGLLELPNLETVIISRHSAITPENLEILESYGVYIDD